MTLEAEEAAVERCLKVYRGTKWRGQPLHVQPANESYLARLQREWQQAAADEAEAALAAAEAQSAGDGEAEGAAPLWGPHELRVRNGAGDSTLLAPPPLRVVPSNCTSSFVCLTPTVSPFVSLAPPLVDTSPAS